MSVTLRTKAEQDLQSYLETRRIWIDRALESCLPAVGAAPGRLHGAMRYSLFAGGKRIRPILAMASFDAVTAAERPFDIKDTLPVVCAIELVHTYSLIHDDLPAMDDDDYRRGRLTSHKKFGEAVAILAGDALLTTAFALLSDRHLNPAIPSDILLSVIYELGSAAGSLGMVGGQFVDVESEGTIGSQTVTQETLEYIHSHKTGSLIRASVRIGAILGKAAPEAMSRLTVYGEKAGLAFQVADDILDVEGTEKETGKRVRKDGAHRKLTYPMMVGLAESKRLEARLIREAEEALAAFGPEADSLRSIARFIVERKS
jgi:geranylgeranyl diphosphate synthase, type II